MPVFRTVSPAGLQKALEEDKGKRVKNTTGAAIPPYRVLAWRTDGTVEYASALDSSVADIAGVSAEIIPNGDYGKIIQSGIVPGILQSLGATPGQTVYLGSSPGSLTLTAPTLSNSEVIQVGRAEPTSNSTDGTAVDLFIEIEFITEN